MLRWRVPVRSGWLMLPVRAKRLVTFAQALAEPFFPAMPIFRSDP